MPRPERPVDPFAGPVEQFAFDLRKLREKAGSPGYRELGKVAHYSASTLADAARGAKLPTLAVTLAFVRACGGNENEWRDRWQELNDTTAPEPIDAPYVGLSPFSEADADRFHGRERLLVKLNEKVAAHRFVLVTGASGSGKSSLLRAGLLASDDRPHKLITPGATPLAHDLGDVELLVVDQFEELFTLCPDQTVRTAFIRALLDSPAQVVVGLRADFYGHCAQHPELVDALEDAQVLVGPMTTDELRSAITQPAIAAGCTLETALVARLIADATGEPGVLPHVSHALLETWSRRRGTTLTLASYHESGGITRAIAQTAEKVYTGLDPDQQHQARQVLLRLTSPGDGTEDTKRRAGKAELGAPGVVEQLAAARLLTLDEDTVEISHEAVIRSWPRLRDWISEDREGLRVHRKLTAAAADWEAHDRDPGALYRGVPLSLATERAARTDLNPQEQAFLDASTAAEQRGTRKLRRLVALLSVLLLVAAVATGFAIHAQRTATEQGTVALVQKAIAEANAMQDTNPALAAQLRLAAYRLSPRPEARDSLLSTFAAPYATRIAAHSDATSEAEFTPDDKTMVTAGRDNILIFWDTTDTHRPVELSRLGPFTDYVHDLKFFNNGKSLVTAGRDGTARLWDTSDPRHPTELGRVTGHAPILLTVAVTPDARVLVTGGEDKTIKLWDITDLRSPKPLSILTGHEHPVHGVTISPDGTLLASASLDGTARLWDIAKPAEPQHLFTITEPDERAVQAVGFSPDGKLLATAGNNRTAKIWDITAPRAAKLLSTITDHTSLIHDLQFSPDGRHLATGSEDKTIRLWDITDPAKPVRYKEFRGHADIIWSLRFNHDGSMLVTTSDDRTVRIEHLREQPLIAHLDTIWGVEYDTAGRFVATAGEDRTARLWRPDGPHLRPLATLNHPMPVGVVLLNRRGDVLLTSDFGGTAKLWDTTDPAHPRELATLPRGQIWTGGGAFSHDGRTLLAIDAAGSARLLDVSDPRNPAEVGVLKLAPASSVAWGSFSGDDRTVAAVVGSREIQLFDISDRAHPEELPSIKESSNVLSAEFSGSTLAVSGTDSTASLWSLADQHKPSRLSTLTGRSGPATRLAFSVDGHQLATAGSDQTVDVWDIQDPAKPVEIATMTGHTDHVWDLAFGPDGSLLSASADHTVRRWDVDVDRVARRVCETAAPVMSKAEWDRYFAGVSYQPPC
ncbi:hypothetical protein FKR81_23395 [Lentzea tibetensis]|uniref:Novel STAND NTPase 1 domain-containing protein n=1 Tax=Lentzea tibetensis TaxID=2591470 RepID=A0A563EQ10_9PSEU|nr:hypothetical protein [Lentzea tibetensis]TWP49494.1 hypothetical protein FKR81_23395 [Lentzea tibetensis]